jgi:hypothetical protein
MAEKRRPTIKLYATLQESLARIADALERLADVYCNPVVITHNVDTDEIKDFHGKYRKDV